MTIASLIGVVVAGAMASSAAPVAGPARAVPVPSVVVLWGTWCVSCRAELARLPTLERASAPLPIVTLALDPPARALERLQATKMTTRNAFADARDPALVLAEWGGAGTALPLAVALDRDGKVCGMKRGLLGTDQLHRWAATCLR